MFTCTICLDSWKSPVALPCGHIFCRECLVRTVQSSNLPSTEQCCSLCRSRYSIVNIDPTLVPEYLRPYVLPSVRRVYVGSSPTSDTTASPAPSDFAHLQAENLWLKQYCLAWRRRAEVHTAATLGLASLARVAKDQAVQMKSERDELETKYLMLKRKAEPSEYETLSHFPKSTPCVSGFRRSFSSPIMSASHLRNDCCDGDEEPPTKRQKAESPTPALAAPPSTSPAHCHCRPSAIRR